MRASCSFSCASCSSAMFLASGYAALSDIAGTASYFAGLGLGPASLLALGRRRSSSSSAGVLLVVGFQTRPTAVVLGAVQRWRRPCSATMGQGGDDAMAAFMHSQALHEGPRRRRRLILLAIAGAWRLLGRRAARRAIPRQARRDPPGERRAVQAVFATTSPSSSIIASRIRNFCGLPVTVIGSSVRKRT